MKQMAWMGLRRAAARTLACGVAGLAMAASASAQNVTAVTAEELEQVLADAGLNPEMTEEAATRAPVASGRVGDISFWVRALDCAGVPKACENLVFFANFSLGREATPQDFRIVNSFNDSQVFGRAYVLPGRNEVGVDYVIDLGGGVAMDHLTGNVARWSDVLGAFIDRFQAGEPIS